VAAGAQIVTEAYAALNRGDVEAALEPLADDAEWMEHSELPEAGCYKGIDSIRALLEGFLESWDDLHQEVETTRAREDRVLVQLRFRGTGRGSGVAVETRYAHLWTLRGEEAVRVDAYYDPDAAEEALGR
jgi:ketosteroid isomerase-like protein